MGHLLLTLTGVLALAALTCGRTVVSREPDTHGTRPPVASRLAVVTRDPDAIFFPDSDDPVAGDADGTFAENVEFVDTTPASGGADTVVAESDKPSTSDSDTVVVESDKPANSDSDTVMVDSDKPTTSDSDTVVVESDKPTTSDDSDTVTIESAEPATSDSGTVVVERIQPATGNSVASNSDAPVIPDSHQPRSSPVRTTVVTRDPDVIVFPDSDDRVAKNPAARDSDVVIESNQPSDAAETVQFLVNTAVSNDSDTVVTETVQPFIVNTSDAPVAIETVQSSVSYSSLDNYFDSIVINIVQTVANSSVTGDVTEVTANIRSVSDEVTEVTANNSLVTNDVIKVAANNSLVSDDVTEVTANNSLVTNDVMKVAANNCSCTGDVREVADDNEVEYQEDDEDEVIPDEYRVRGHNDSFAERTGLVMRAAIVAPRRRSNKGRMVGGVYRTPV